MDRRKYRKTVALMSMLSETKTIDNADIASFDGDGENLLSLIVGIDSIQDLHGYDSPWSAGGGKNKLPNNATDTVYTNNGVTVTVKNGVYSFSGRSSAYVNIIIPLSQPVDLSPSSNKIAFLNNKASSLSFGFYRSGTGQIHFWTMSSTNRVGSDWTDSGNEVIDCIQISVGSGIDVSGLVLSPMLISLLETDPTSFSPYSNICPISGWAGANVYHSGADTSDATTYSITFPTEAGTVYGGTLNVTTGKLVVNRVLHSFTGDENFSLLVASSVYARRFGVKLSGISGLPPVLTDDVICSHGVQKISTEANLYDFVAANDYISFYDYDGAYSTVSAFKANLAERYNSGNPVQACFFLKDPIVYDVDPVAIKTLVGQNNIWADTGKIIFLEYES